jgi:hypothetical protein
MDYAKTTGLLLLVVIGLVSTILQIAKVIDIIASITDIWIWIAAVLIGVAFGLITRKEIPKKTAEPPPEVIKKSEETSPQKRLATIVVDCPNCIKKYPPSIEDMLRMQDLSNPKNPLRSGKTTCPKCGKPARIYLDYLKGD